MKMKKTLILLSFAAIGCTKSNHTIINPPAPEKKISLAGTKWRKVDNKRMAYRFTADSMLGLDTNSGIQYRINKDSIVFFADSSTWAFRFTVVDSIMTWVNYPYKGYAVSFKQLL